MSELYQQLAESTYEFFHTKTKEKYNLQELENNQMYSISDLGLYVESPEGMTRVKSFIRKNLSGSVVEFEIAEAITCANAHMFDTPNGLKFVTELSVGDLVNTVDGTDMIKSITALQEPQDFFDIEVSNSSSLYYTANGVCNKNTGKTHTVEETLSSMGLTDGSGYFKNTGSASPVGIYIMLYENRNGIVLFDDSDGALADQDGRNLIKAATDTKKVRKLAWTKKSSSFVTPLDDGEEYEEGTYPKFFDFKGRVIFISNLPINKLDPDGALRTRALMIDINPTDLELIDFMTKLAPKFKLEDGLHLSVDERLEVVELFKSASSKSGISLRKLERGLNMRAALGSSGDWERMIKLYA